MSDQKTSTFMLSVEQKKYGIIGVIAAILLLVGGILLYRYYEKKKSEKTPVQLVLSSNGQNSASLSDMANQVVYGENTHQTKYVDDHETQMDRINKMTSGQCEKLDGCDRKVCEELFPNGFYPRPMDYKNVPKSQILIPPTFSRHYDQMWKPPHVSQYWPTPSDQDEIDYYQGDLSEFDQDYVRVDHNKPPLVGTDGLSLADISKIQSPRYANQGMQGIHEFGDPIGYQKFSGQ